MKIERWGETLAIRIDDATAAKFGLQEGDELSIVVKSRWLNSEASDAPYQELIMSCQGIDAKDVVTAMHAQQNRPFVSLANEPSPYHYEESPIPGCVVRVDAQGNRVTGYLKMGGFAVYRPDEDE